MSVYFQRERRNLEQVIDAEGIVLFDTPIASSESRPTPADPDDPLPMPIPDFEYQLDGTIDIFRESVYMVCWNTASVAGMSTDGQVFQLKKRDYEAETLDPLAGEIWTELGSGSAAFKASASVGFTTFRVSEQELIDFDKATVALFNTSNDAIKLSRHPHSKSGIIIFGVGAIDTDISRLYRYINELYEFITYSDIHIFNCYSNPFYLNGPNPNPSKQIPLDHSPDTNHFQMGVIWSGYTYNFWLISPENGTTNPRLLSFSQNVVYRLLRSEDFDPLTWYQGQATFGTVWCDSGNSTTSTFTAIPVMIDHSGLYIKPTTSMNNIRNMKFTQTLILTPPDPNPPTP